MELLTIISVLLIITAAVGIINSRRMAKKSMMLKEYEERINAAYQPKINYLDKALMHEEHYFTHSEMEDFLKGCESLNEDYKVLDENKALARLDGDALRLYEYLKDTDHARKIHNDAFVARELSNNKEFFDTILNYPLDIQQRQSIVKLEDNCLVISSAGSGKTSTMIGKLLYLVNVRGMDPSRILTITYTHKASDELNTRLKGTGLSCMTFHKLAMNIVSEVDLVKPSIADAGLFLSVFYERLKDSEFRKNVLTYITDQKSLVKAEHDYDSPIDYYKDRRKYGVIALYPDMRGRMIATKSEEEKNLCSYLTELGVSFLYEEAYEYNTLTTDYRQYRPDFSIYYKDSSGAQRRIYLEHFAINAEGMVPKWFGHGRPDGWNQANQEYKEGIEWKKELHKEHHTTLLWTTSADFHSGRIREQLRQLLIEAGVPINPPSPDELLDRVLSRNKSLENALLQMTQSFITLVKANNKSIDDVIAVARSKEAVRDEQVIEKIMRPLWNDYHLALQQRGEMDFTDAIVKATKYCNDKQWTKRFDYILIDEFQDISVDRYHFLLGLRSENPRTKLYCVGDDWQSIYRFAGSDLSLFAEYPKYFGYTEECRIETTYRFGNPLINESSKFVLNNPQQKQKTVHPRPVNPPETKISFMPYSSNDELQSLIERMVARVPDDKTACIISRYTNDVNALLSSSIKPEYNAESDTLVLFINGRKVKFMTIHASKGLEADYVFILNCNSGLYGFPSLVSDDPVLDYVLCDPEHFEYAEERRVYYVGITRAKVHTVVLYDSAIPSPFVTEMHKEAINTAEQCPWCGTGHRIIKYQGFTQNKTPYRVWGCDNRQANCQYFEREFQNSTSGTRRKRIGL